MNYERSLPKEDLEGYKIGGAISHRYDIMAPYMVGKGGGSVYGGDWRPSPNKPEDQRLVGEPNTVNTQGTNQTHIGNNGKADYERHNTDHNKPWAHTNPHDHKIDWSDGFPKFGPPINYTNGAPDFENIFKGAAHMCEKMIQSNTLEQNRFSSISDFKWCMRCGGEVEFVWDGITYSVTHYNGLIAISHSRRRETEMQRETADEILEYMVGSSRLRDVIKEVTVLYRTV